MGPSGENLVDGFPPARYDTEAIVYVQRPDRAATIQGGDPQKFKINDQHVHGLPKRSGQVLVCSCMLLLS